MDAFEPPKDYIKVELPEGFMPSLGTGLVADAIFLPPEHVIAFKKSIGLITTPKQETKELETQLYDSGKIPVMSKG